MNCCGYALDARVAFIGVVFGVDVSRLLLLVKGIVVVCAVEVIGAPDRYRHKNLGSACNSRAIKRIRFSWITLPLRSTSTECKVVHTCTLSSCSCYIELVIHYYWIL